jgi:hypothetical protein
MDPQQTLSPYQVASSTSVPPVEVFATLRSSLKDGQEVIERGSGYVIVGRRRPIPGLREGAIAVAVVGVMVVLAMTAINPLLVVLLPLPLFAAIPFVFDRRERVAVAAASEESTTTVTLHGRATPYLKTTLSEFLAQLPENVPGIRSEA